MGWNEVRFHCLTESVVMDFSFTPESWLCRRIVEATPVAIVFADREGLVRLWNPAAAAMFGYTADEVLGHSMDFMIPERHRERHWEGYARVMQTGVTKYGHQLLAVPALTKDGRRISIEFNVALLRSESGDVLGAAATIQNVTERWERDKQLRARLAAAEAKLRELEASWSGKEIRASS
jgi:PAS domain S-box-containing protein